MKGKTMALHKEWLLRFAKAILENKVKGPTYSLGDQQTLFTYDYALRRLKTSGCLVNPGVTPLPDHCRPYCLSFKSFLAMLGIDEYEDIDINGKAALNLDFSLPLPPRYVGTAGAIFDLGTIEHIFNASQAFINVSQFLRKDGLIIHCSPMTAYQHGFYNFNPLLFWKFYQANGFEIVDHTVIISPLETLFSAFVNGPSSRARQLKSGAKPFILYLDDTNKWFRYFNNFIFHPSRMNLFFAARKARDNDSVVYPLQID
jgi:hypothetical protein